MSRTHNHPVALILLLLLAACGGDGNGNTSPPPAALTVQSVHPPAGATNADPSSDVGVVFSAALAPGTATPAAFAIARAGQALATLTRYDAGSKSVQIEAPLVPEADYGVTVATTVTGAAGEQLAQPFQWSFSTRTWQPAALAPVSGARGVALVAEPSGTVHLLHWTPDPAGGFALRYAACPSSCASPANWTGVAIDHDGAGISAALILDSGAGVHVVYGHGSSGDLYYGHCSSSCTSAASWQTVKLGLDNLDGSGVTLGVDASGRVHLATGLFTGVSHEIAYATCAADCTNPASWQSVVFDADGYAPSLAVEPSGDRHIVYRAGSEILRYAFCTGSCLGVGDWQTTDVDPAIGSRAPAVVLDENGFLHVVYRTSAGLSYATCGSNCTGSAGWTTAVVDEGGGGEGRVSLARGPDGRLHAVFEKEHDLGYTTCVTGCAAAADWQSVVAAGGTEPRFSVTAIDAAGVIHVAWEGIAASTLWYAE